MRNEIIARIAISGLLLLGNIAVIAILAGIGLVAYRAGPMFCLGCIVGSAFTFVAIRLHLGYWV